MSRKVSELSDAFSTLQIVLSQAIQKNDQASVEALLLAYSPNNIPIARISNSLQIAIKHNRLEIIKLLINKGVSVSMPLNCFQQNALHIAALYRNKEVILHILQCGADWRAVDIDNANVLHLVLAGGVRCEDSDIVSGAKGVQRMIIEILQIFLNLGVDVNGCTKYSESPLELAIRSGMIDVAKFLIQSGADPNVCNKRGDRILHILIRYVVKQNQQNGIAMRNDICHKGQILDFVRWMQSEGIEIINTPNLEEVTPLHMAINHRLDTIVPILMGLTDDSSFVNAHGQSNLHIALAKFYDCKFDSDNRDDDSIIVNLVRQMLNDGANVNVVDNSGNTPLHVAAKQKNDQLIQMMLKQFTNVDARSHYGETVLHILISNSIDVNGKYEKSYEGYVKDLLSRGADPNLKNGKGMTPVQLTIQQKHDGILKVLADHGADLKVRTKDGDDLFQLLIRSSVNVHEPAAYENIVEVLINNGFDIDELDNNGHTFLHQATLWGDDRLIKALLAKGAAVNCRDNSLRRLTPLHIAIRCKSISIIETFLEYGADGNILTKDGESPLAMAIKKDYFTLVKSLLEAGVEVNTATKHGESPLNLAARKGEFKLIKLLLDYGACVNFCKVKTTPLHAAVDVDQKDLIELLVKAGADVNARNASGETPLHLAARHGSSVMKYLVESGAKIYLLDDKNRSALYRTVESSNIEGLDYLISLGEDVNEIGRIQLTMSSLFGDPDLYDNVRMKVNHHLIKLHAIGLLVPELNEECVQKEAEFSERCLNEVKMMKTRFIGQTSLYDIIHMSLKRRMVHVKYVPLESYFSDFPIYISLIKQIFREAVERKELLESATSAWYEMTNFVLPDLCLEIIFNYVNNYALKRFIKCAEDTRRLSILINRLKLLIKKKIWNSRRKIRSNYSK